MIRTVTSLPLNQRGPRAIFLPTRIKNVTATTPCRRMLTTARTSSSRIISHHSIAMTTVRTTAAAPHRWSRVPLSSTRRNFYNEPHSFESEFRPWEEICLDSAAWMVALAFFYPTFGFHNEEHGEEGERESIEGGQGKVVDGRINKRKRLKNKASVGDPEQQQQQSQQNGQKDRRGGGEDPPNDGGCYR